MTKRRIVILLLSISLFILGALIGAFAPGLQGKQNFDWLIVKKLEVLEGGASFGSDVTFEENVTVGHLAGRSTFLRYQDVAAVPSIRAQATVLATVQAVSSNILGIETPRNLIITYVTATTATVGSITVTGIDARGEAATELIAVSAVSGTQTLVGSVPWQSVTSLALPARAEDVTLTVAGGQKFGLPYLPETAADVYHLTVAATPQTAPTVNPTYGTFDPVSTPAAGVDYNVWLKQ